MIRSFFVPPPAPGVCVHEFGELSLGELLGGDLPVPQLIQELEGVASTVTALLIERVDERVLTPENSSIPIEVVKFEVVLGDIWGIELGQFLRAAVDLGSVGAAGHVLLDWVRGGLLFLGVTASWNSWRLTRLPMPSILFRNLSMGESSHSSKFSTSFLVSLPSPFRSTALNRVWVYCFCAGLGRAYLGRPAEPTDS